MASGYIPLFSSLTSGTLCGIWPDVGLWPIVLSLSDKFGVVDVTPMYLSKVTGLPETEVIACMGRFCEPDPYSRTGTERGARLVLIDSQRAWGWKIVNHGFYREKARKQMQQLDATASGRDADRKRLERVSGAVRRSPAKPSADRPSDSDSDSDANSNANANTNTNTNTTQRGEADAPPSAPAPDTAVPEPPSRQTAAEAASRALDRLKPPLSEIEISKRWREVRDAYPAQGYTNAAYGEAKRHCEQLVQNGATWSSLLASTRAYASYCHQAQCEPMSVVTFFGSSDEPWRNTWQLEGTRSPGLDAEHQAHDREAQK